MFPCLNPFYSYESLLAAAAAFPELGTTGDDDTRKREIAAFLANVAHETGGLVYVEESTKDSYCDESWGPPGCNCVDGQSYYGRGSLQLSWNGNYCAAGDALGLPLAQNPGMVAQDPNLAWKTGFWFWMTQTGAGSMTPHDAIVSGAGFGETIRSINGAAECDGANTVEVLDRLYYYHQFANLLGVSPGANESC
jgi:chitinase